MDKKGVKPLPYKQGVTIRLWRCREGMTKLERAQGHTILGICGGRALIECGEMTPLVLGPGALAFVPRHMEYTLKGIQGGTVVECICHGYLPVETERVFGAMKGGKAENWRWTPLIGPEDRLTESLEGIVRAEALLGSEELCELKTRELVLTALLTRGEGEMARWMAPLMMARDNFEAFVWANHDRAKGVEHLAELAGMGLSTFKRRFSQTFGESVYQWMMKQKARAVEREISGGRADIQELMSRLGFHSHVQFNRFCHKYLGEAPSKLLKRNNTTNQIINATENAR